MKKYTLLFFCSVIFFSLHAQSYKKIHRKAILVDTHNDVISTVSMRGLNMDDDLLGKTHSDLNRFKKGGVDVQVFSIFSDERFGKDTAFKYANIEIDSLYAIVARNPKKMMIVKTAAELQTAIRKKKLACMMGLEGGHMIEDRIDYLDSLAKRGVRYMTLTWNNSTSWATSAMDETRKKDSLPHKGLTDFGKQIIKRMNELGVIVDVSHVGEQTFWDAINTSTKPVIASHSCVWNLCPVFRNLKDDQIKAIGQNGGVIHLNFYSGFLDSTYQRRKSNFLQLHKAELDSLKKLKLPNYEADEYLSQKYPQESGLLRAPLSLLIDHLDYIVKLIGVDHVGIGSDFDGIESAPVGLDGVQDFPTFTKALKERGYSREDINKILGGNFIRVFNANHPG